MTAVHGFLVKAAPTVVTGVVGVAAYEALMKAPWRKATVIATAWGLRVVREAERKAGQSAEHARLTVADVVAEARERAGDEVPPLTVTGSGDDE
jgi:chaperone-like protein